MNLSRPRPRRRCTRGAVVLAASVAALALAGCAGQEQSGTPAQRITTWVNGAGGSGIGSVEVDVHNVDLALAKHNRPDAVREVCALLSNDAQSAIGNLPTPYDQLTDELNDAYTVATSAGDDCYNGAGGRAALEVRSATERSRTLTLLAVAVRYIESVTGQTPSTATTAPPDNADPFSGNT
ncbi:MAG: hypothetical protein ABSF84_05110 [Acidimicrobiales bacterium]